MQESSAKRSFEDILAAVESDPTLTSGQMQQAEAERGGERLPDDSPLAGLSGLLSRPELLAKLPLLLKTVQSLTEPLPDVKNGKRPDTPEALLCALRPYLNEHRRQAVDTMLRVSRLSASLKSWQ